jgi:hypothetical protein
MLKRSDNPYSDLPEARGDLPYKKPSSLIPYERGCAHGDIRIYDKHGVLKKTVSAKQALDESYDRKKKLKIPFKII